MKRVVLSLVALALAAPVASTTLEAQSKLSFGAGGGLTLPLGDFNDVAKLGWHGLAVVGYAPSGSPIGFRGDFMYAQNSVDGADGKTKLAGGLVNVTYAFQSKGSVKPYLIGGLGLFNAKVEVSGFGSDSETKLAAGGGIGLKFRAGSDASIFAESRFINVFTSDNSTNFVPLTIGIQFGTR